MLYKNLITISILSYLAMAFNSREQLFEGMDNEVTLLFIFFTTAVVVALYTFFRSSANENRVHPAEESGVADFRRRVLGTDDDPPTEENNSQEGTAAAALVRRQYGEDRDCPICYAEAKFAVLTNCGHLFCCNCIYGYWRHSASILTPVKCAVCREKVTLLIPLPATGERENNAMEAARCDDLLKEYNHRFSGESRRIMDYINDLPVLLPQALSAMTSVNGLMFMFRVRMALCLIGVVAYVLSPFDFLPEATLGVFGMLDDIFILIIVSVYTTVLFRQFVAGQGIRFGGNIDDPHQDD